METMCISDDRDMIIHVLRTETNEKVVRGHAPDFTCTVGKYQLLRDGRIVTEDDSDGIFHKLAYLGLCSNALSPPPGNQPCSHVDKATQYTPSAPRTPNDPNIQYSLQEEEGFVLLNLFCIFSARQSMLNQALAARGAFHVSATLMDRLLAHPPQTVPEVLRVLYRREEEYRGIRIDQESGHYKVVLTGFRRCPQEDAPIHRQLAELIIQAAREHQWIKPYTRNVRNRKYAFHTWLYQIGMTGTDYAEARSILLGRLYGQSGHRRIRQ